MSTRAQIIALTIGILAVAFASYWGLGRTSPISERTIYPMRACFYFDRDAIADEEIDAIISSVANRHGASYTNDGPWNEIVFGNREMYVVYYNAAGQYGRLIEFYWVDEIPPQALATIAAEFENEISQIAVTYDCLADRQSTMSN